MDLNCKSNTLVIGLGEVGKPLYTILKQSEADAVGIDIAPQAFSGPVGILHICIPFKVQETFCRTVVAYARQYAPELIVINSTVVPGTTRRIEQESGVPSVYSPVRGKHVKMVEDLRHYVKFVAGTQEKAVSRVVAQLRQAGLNCETMSAPETLELAKLFETTYFGVLIAWAQEMNRLANAAQADYLQITRFFREVSYLPPVVFQPGFIGGHCVMPNIALLKQRFESSFLDTIVASNELRRLELEAENAADQVGARIAPITSR